MNTRLFQNKNGRTNLLQARCRACLRVRLFCDIFYTLRCDGIFRHRQYRRVAQLLTTLSSRSLEPFWQLFGQKLISASSSRPLDIPYIKGGLNARHRLCTNAQTQNRHKHTHIPTQHNALHTVRDFNHCR